MNNCDSILCILKQLVSKQGPIQDYTEEIDKLYEELNDNSLIHLYKYTKVCELIECILLYKIDNYGDKNHSISLQRLNNVIDIILRKKVKSV